MGFAFFVRCNCYHRMGLSFIHSPVFFGGGGSLGLNQEFHQELPSPLSLGFLPLVDDTGFLDGEVPDAGLPKPNKLASPPEDCLFADFEAFPLAIRLGS